MSLTYSYLGRPEEALQLLVLVINRLMIQQVNFLLAGAL
jgi:hypothetical protein